MGTLTFNFSVMAKSLGEKIGIGLGSCIFINKVGRVRCVFVMDQTYTLGIYYDNG